MENLYTYPKNWAEKGHLTGFSKKCQMTIEIIEMNSRMQKKPISLSLPFLPHNHSNLSLAHCRSPELVTSKLGLFVPKKEREKKSEKKKRQKERSFEKKREKEKEGDREGVGEEEREKKRK